MEEKKDIFERLKNGEAVSMFEEEFGAAVRHMDVTRKLCFKINHTVPDLNELRPMFGEMLNAPLPEGTNIIPPVQIDLGKQMTLGKKCIYQSQLNLYVSRRHHH